MGLNRKCPKCGSEKTKLSTAHNKQKHGIVWWVFVGWWWIALSLMIGIFIFLLIDWWMFIIAKAQNKGYVWKCVQWFSLDKKYYHCEKCGHDFRG